MDPRPDISIRSASLTATRFHVPFEHGAWWSFGATLIGALAVALAHQADGGAVVGLSVALFSAFLAQDWGQAVLGALWRRRSQALSTWDAPQGAFLAGLCLGGSLLLLQRLSPSQRLPGLVLLGFLALAGAGALTARVLQSGRGRRSLAWAALLLSAPALLLGWLTFGATATGLGFWAWPLLYYPAATLAAQSYIRGYPERARWAGPALALTLGLAALAVGAWVAGGLLLAQAGLLWLGIRARWRAHPQGLPPGGEIRGFGRRQAAFGVVLTVLWAWSYARR